MIAIPLIIQQLLLLLLRLHHACQHLSAYQSRNCLRIILLIHLAHLDVQMAAFALSAGQPADAIKLANRAMPAVTRSENAALLASLLMIKAEAMALTGNAVQAQALRLDSMGWARYGFGTDDEVRRYLTEIALLSPLQGG